MVQLAALAVQPSTFDPLRSTLAASQLLGSQIQQGAGMLQLRDAQQRQAALDAFQAHGGFGNPQALQHLTGEPQLFTSALQGYSNYQSWMNTQNALAAQRVLTAGAEGSETRTQAWQQELSRALAERRIDQNTHAQLLSQQPTDTVLQRLIDMARPIGSEPTGPEILRLGLGPGGGGGQPPPSGGRSPFNPDLSALSLSLRDRAGLVGITPQDMIGPLPTLAPTGGPQVYGWQGGPQTPPGVTYAPSTAPGYNGMPDVPYAGLGPTMASMMPSSRYFGQSDPRFAGQEYLGRVLGSEAPVSMTVPPTGGTVPPSPPLSMTPSAPTEVGMAGVPTSRPSSGTPQPGGETPFNPPEGVTLSSGLNTVNAPSLALDALTRASTPETGAPSTEPRTVGEAIMSVLSRPNVTAAQRARFWSLWARTSTRDDAMKFLGDVEGVTLPANQRMEREAGLRHEFQMLARPYFDVRDAYSRIQASSQQPSAAGDLSLIFSFMKMLDPTSVVREGEQATAANARGIPDAIMQLYNRILNGERLTVSQRADFVNQAHLLMGVQERQYLAIQQQYGGIARRLGLNPDNIMIDFTRPPPQAPPGAGGGQSQSSPTGVPGIGFAPSGGGGAQPPVRISGDAEYQGLASGTHFVGPDGVERIKP